MLEILRQALHNLAAYRARSLLTLFGVAWGTASVVFLMSWGEGVKVMLEEGFMKTGKNMGQVWPGRVSEQFTPASDRRYLWFTQADVEFLRRRARLPERIGAERWAWLTASSGPRELQVDVRGVDEDVLAIRDVGIAAGRTINAADLAHRRRVALLGARMRRDLLGPGQGLGARFQLEGQSYQVIGLLEPVGTQLSRDRDEIDDMIWIPLASSQTLFPAWWTRDTVVHRVLYRMPDRSLREETEAEVRALLAERLRVPATDEEAIGIFSSVEMLETLRVDRVAGVLFLIAVTTLVVGGIGVATMMLDAVHQRRREIGLRLAVGARRRDVVLQILLESFGVTAVGGLVGLVLGIAFCAGLAKLEVEDLIPLPILQPGIVATALFVLIAVGTLAGLAPARRATRVDPSIALRME